MSELITEWPTFSLAGVVRPVSASEFLKRLTAAPEARDSGPLAFSTVVNLEGSANALWRNAPLPADDECRALVKSLCEQPSVHWRPQHLVLIDAPCYLVVDGGAVLLQDGRIVTETVFPSHGEDTLERRIGGGVDRGNIEELLRTAPTVDAVVPAPLLSRWSATYFHALTEALVQDAVIASAGLSGLVSYVAPAAPVSGAQHAVLAHASCRIQRCTAPIVKVPRVIFFTAFYKHAALGLPFRTFVERSRIAAGGVERASRSSRHERVYVSRVRAATRRMTNEGELISRLEELGFEVFEAEGRSLSDHVRAFSGASLIVGPHGSGLANAAFARAGATLCELRPLNTRGQTPMRVEEYSQLAAVMGFAYCAHVSRNSQDSEEWAANIPEIVSLIRAIT